VIGSVAARSYGYGSQPSAPKSDARSAPKAPPAQGPSGVLGQGGEQKPGHRGAIGTQGPAPGIQSPTRVEAQPRQQTRNLRANLDGSIQYAVGSRIDTKVTITQKTVEPTTPLKTRAEAMRGTKIDARG
jgi:hypothetical protein